MKTRPRGSNADEWHMFLCEMLDSRATSPDGLTFASVQIAEAIEAAVAEERAIRGMKTAAERYDAVTEEYRKRWGGEYGGRSGEYREMMMATIDAAVAEERARCARIVRNASSASYPIIWQVVKRAAETIERGDEP